MSASDYETALRMTVSNGHYTFDSPVAMGEHVVKDNAHTRDEYLVDLEFGQPEVSKDAVPLVARVDCQHYDFGLLGNLTPNQAEVLGQQLLDAAAVARENAADESDGGEPE